MTFLLLSFVGLLLGPLVYQVARRSTSLVIGLDAFVLVTLSGLLLLHVIPQSIEIAGPVAALLALLAIPASLALEHGTHTHHAPALLPLALLALAGHALLDGMGLALPTPAGGGISFLALAVVVHRLPLGIGVWWLVRPRFGLRVALSTLAVEIGGTLLGWFLGGEIVALVSDDALALLQAVLAGFLLHVVALHPPAQASSPLAGRRHVASTLGTLFGLGILATIEISHSLEGADAHEAHETARAALLQVGPTLLMAYLLAALTSATVAAFSTIRGQDHFEARAFPWRALLVPRSPRRVVVQFCAATHRGLSLQQSAVQLLLLQGLEPVAFFALLLFAGLLPALGLVLAFVALAFLIGKAMQALNERQLPAHPHAHSSLPESSTGPGLVSIQRFGSSFGEVFWQSVDRSLPWVIAGWGLVTALEVLLGHDWPGHLPPLLGPALVAFLAFPLHLAPLGSVVFVLLTAPFGLSPGAALAACLAGSGFGVTVFLVMRRLRGTLVALTYGAGVLLFAILGGVTLDALFPGPLSEAPMDSLLSGRFVLAGPLSLLGLAGLLINSLLRQGARGFVEQVLAPLPLGEHLEQLCHAHPEPDRAQSTSCSEHCARHERDECEHHGCLCEAPKEGASDPEAPAPSSLHSHPPK